MSDEKYEEQRRAPLTQRERFDRTLGLYHGLPGSKTTRPTTILETIPIGNQTMTAVVQTMKTEDAGVLIFLQVVRGEDTVQLVLPDKVAQAIYRQRERLFDRSTPESRRRKADARERKRKREEKARRQLEWRRRNPEGKVGAKK